MNGLVKIGWRKLGAWFLCFLLGAAIAVLNVTKAPAGQVIDLPPNVKDFLQWVTGFFFGANVAKAGLQMIAGKVGKDVTG